MKFTISAAAFVCLIPSIMALTILTPSNVVQCQPTKLFWSDGTPPFFISILPGGQPSAPAIKSFPTQEGNELSWTVDIQAGTSITLSLKDSTGTQAYSDIVTINSSSDSSCLNTSVQVSASGGSAAPTTAGNTSAGASATSPANSASTTAGSSGSNKPASNTASATRTASSGSASTSNAASRGAVNTLGMAGLLGLVGIAAF